MSTYSFSCHNFVENTWRKGICTNCFRPKEQHNKQQTEISVNYNTTAYGNNYRQQRTRSVGGGVGDNILSRINVVGSSTPALMTQSQFSHGHNQNKTASSATKNVNFCGGSDNNNKRRMDKEDFEEGGGGRRGIRKPNFSVGGPMRSVAEQKGILKSKDKDKKIKGGSGGRRNVCFPKEVRILKEKL
jgi:hypothetical protein